MSKHTIWFKDGFNLKVDCIDDLKKDSGYLTMKVDIDKVRMQNPHCILKVNINCKGCEKKIRKLLLKIHVVDAVSIDAEQEKVTILGNKLDPNELIKELKKSRKQAEICNENGNGGKKNGNGSAGENSGNATGGKKNGNASGGGNNGNASGGKKNGNDNANGGESNGNGNASEGGNNGNTSGGKKNGNGNANGSENNGNGNGNASGGGNNRNTSGGKKNGNGNANGGENNGNENGNASGGGNNGNGNMAQMVPIGGGGYYHQGMPMQMQPYSYEQLHHMMMMNQQQHMNMYPQAMNYMPPPSIPFRCMADHPAYIFNDENVHSCRIM